MTTLGHVCACSPDRLQEFQNCGAKTAKEIEQAMAECGLPLGFNVRRMRQRFSKLI
jgi:DNA-directed RNA polymerase alpha subunit